MPDTILRPANIETSQIWSTKLFCRNG